ncbi:hypothetical protein PCANC_00610 [Puccinia coronata f. sp. avenae]|uniref:Peptidyl-tRNA hydrolase n=1 Tax=Puccinia coronata f. sp. avenae TaxID=200324 RepID=A0A2N5VEF4_9BASI|nr:hypothetical protein PCASD_02860 [Puccinia coronata f. sp. avenae]PLW58358.1 hypothetical protein PCANC_00610 [Puccinia coronata f. sp. avenae]
MTLYTANALVVGLGNFTHPLTRHSISQLTLENIHTLLNQYHHQHRSLPSPPIAHRETVHRIQSDTQGNSDLSNHLKLSKPHAAWIAKHDLQLHYHANQPTSRGTTHLSLHLLKPRAQMNISGPVVHSYHAHISKASPGQQQTKLIIIHDELDLHPLTVKLKQPPQSSKHKGHNGLRSVFSSLKNYPSRNVYTIAVGIGRDPTNPSKDPRDVGAWVLSPLTRSEINACSWDIDRAPSFQQDQNQSGSVVFKVWKEILGIVTQN